MRARAVIGANFGDEGKGILVDNLCAGEGAGMIVRHNGGCQAGHTVVTPDGRRHVFSHFGSGTFVGVPTYLSQFFICNPICFFRELQELVKLGLRPHVYAHPSCLVTTYADMIINQRLEDKRGDKRHGSCGVGFAETIERDRIAPKLTITMADLWNDANLQPRLEQICGKYAQFRDAGKIDEPNMLKHFQIACKQFAEIVEPLGIQQCKDPIFEGAQGLLLDQHNRAMFPHLTRSNTGVKNVRELCKQAGIDKLDAYYVSRTYLTRHGAGPLPGEDASLSYTDNTNMPHKYQGELRFAPLDWTAMLQRSYKDFGDDTFKVALTHCDQLEQPASLERGAKAAADLRSYGPTRNDVRTQIAVAA